MQVVSVQPSLLFSIHYLIPYPNPTLFLDIFENNWISDMKIDRDNSAKAYLQVFLWV